MEPQKQRSHAANLDRQDIETLAVLRERMNTLVGDDGQKGTIGKIQEHLDRQDRILFGCLILIVVMKFIPTDQILKFVGGLLKL